MTVEITKAIPYSSQEIETLLNEPDGQGALPQPAI